MSRPSWRCGSLYVGIESQDGDHSQRESLVDRIFISRLNESHYSSMAASGICVPGARESALELAEDFGERSSRQIRRATGR